MNTRNNSIFLGYCQDAVRRLPTIIAERLTASGGDVYMEHDHFLSDDPPPEHIRQEIERRGIYLLLLTPASARYGFKYVDPRLKLEIKHAESSGNEIIVMCGYDFPQSRLEERKSRYDLPERAQVITVDHHELDLTLLLPIIGHAYSNLDVLPDLSDHQTRQLEAEYLIDQALTENYDAQMDNRGSESMRYLNQAVDTDPDYAYAYFSRAEQWYFEHRHPNVDRVQCLKRALDDYNRAITLDATEARFYVGRSKLLQRLKSYDDALADYNQAIALAPTTARYYSSRSDVHRYMGQLDAEISDCTMAIQLRPAEPRYYYSRSGSYYRVGETQKAIDDISRAIDLMPRYVPENWYVVRSMLYLDLNMDEEAEADWETVIATAKREDGVYSFAASMHKGRGHYQEARRLAKIAISINPNNRGARWILRQLGEC